MARMLLLTLLVACGSKDDTGAVTDTDDPDITGTPGTGTGGATGTGTGDTSPTAPSTILGSGSTCADILAAEPSSTNGLYELTGDASAPLSAFCDMEGGGWTLAFVSSQTAADKAGLDAFFADAGAGALDDDGAHYALAEYVARFHHEGITLRLSWLCGTDLGVVGVRSNPGRLSSGEATWTDLRAAEAVTASTGGFHLEHTDLTVDGDPCWDGDVRTDVVYGWAVGNGDDYGQYVGWFSFSTASSTAISDQAYDNVPSTVAGWFR